MTQSLNQLLARHSLQVIARFAQTNAADAYISDDEFLAHQVVQWHIARHNVAASLAWSELDIVLAPQRFNRLRLDQREFEVRFGLEECALFKGVTISFQPDAGSQHRLIQSLNRPCGGGGDVDRLYFSVPHRVLPAMRFARRWQSPLPARRWRRRLRL